jgi:hypothetical protein
MALLSPLRPVVDLSIQLEKSKTVGDAVSTDNGQRTTDDSIEELIIKSPLIRISNHTKGGAQI